MIKKTLIRLSRCKLSQHPIVSAGWGVEGCGINTVCFFDFASVIVLGFLIPSLMSCGNFPVVDFM